MVERFPMHSTCACWEKTVQPQVCQLRRGPSAYALQEANRPVCRVEALMSHVALCDTSCNMLPAALRNRAVLGLTIQ